MEVLWAPWRMAYIGAESRDDGCIFCRALEGDPRDRLLLGASDGLCEREGDEEDGDGRRARGSRGPAATSEPRHPCPRAHGRES